MIAERLDAGFTRWSKVAAIFLAGWFASSGVHGTLSAAKAIKAVPVLQAEAGCEHWRANKTAIIAKKAIAGANSADAPIPSPNAIPQDRCPHTVAH